MKISQTPLAASLFVAASLTTLASTSRAVTFAESGDAGQTLATATLANTGGSPLTAITGTIGTTTDADLYRIFITNTTSFSATASSTAGIDTSLFLFTSGGVPVEANDDLSNTNFQAALPAGNSLLTILSPGTYYLGISLSGNEAVNLNNQQLFTVDQPTTNIRGAASGLNPNTEGTFNGGTFFAETGAYSIAITSAVPEPSTWAALAMGSIAAGFTFLRRRTNRA